MESFITFLRAKIWHIVFLLAVAYFAFLIRSDVIQNDRLEKERAAASAGLSSEKSRQASLKYRMKLMNSSGYVEKTAREKLGLVIHGESPYKVIIK